MSSGEKNEIQQLKEQVANLELAMVELQEKLAPAIQVWADLAGVARMLKLFGNGLMWIAGIIGAVAAAVVAVKAGK